MNGFLRASISNGVAEEQALIRRWWHEVEHASGLLVWEYYLEGRYVDAVWFPGAPGSGEEFDGKSAPVRFPLKGAEAVLCEAKKTLTPELVGQALVYSVFALRAGARLRETIVFAETGDGAMCDAARELGLAVALGNAPSLPPVRPLNLSGVRSPGTA